VHLGRSPQSGSQWQHTIAHLRLVAQILVFSWWPGALSVLGDALRSNGVPHVYGEGKAA
jgi:hypothetical protein